MSRIFVTGATGYLGTALVERLRRAGHEVTGVGSKEADLTREGTLEPYSAVPVDRIFHLAAWTQAEPFQYWTVKSVRPYCVKVIVVVGSAGVYTLSWTLKTSTSVIVFAPAKSTSSQSGKLLDVASFQ